MLAVRDIMSHYPITVSATTSLREILRLMQVHTIRQVPVLEQNEVIGIVTDRDIRLAFQSPLLTSNNDANKLIDEITAERCMTPNPVIVTPDTPVYKAAEILAAHKFGALPVVQGGILVGIITVTDLMRYMAGAGFGT